MKKQKEVYFIYIRGEKLKFKGRIDLYTVGKIIEYLGAIKKLDKNV